MCVCVCVHVCVHMCVHMCVCVLGSIVKRFGDVVMVVTGTFKFAPGRIGNQPLSLRTGSMITFIELMLTAKMLDMSPFEWSPPQTRH